MDDTFTPAAPLQTAVLFLVFNRPDTTAQVFEAIRQAKPPRLYVAADGHREGREGEAKKVAKVREIATAVDWPCEVKTLFREKNLGCKYAVSGGISWFFENEVQGIILEDDCLPSQSFFWFCEELLVSYKDEKRVGMISGNNTLNKKPTTQSDSFLYSYGNIWGWATWRDRWARFAHDISSWHEENQRVKIENFLDIEECKSHYSMVFDGFLERNIDSWAIPWLFARLKNKMLTINPSVNLVANIGFGLNATHTLKKDGQTACFEFYEMSWPLIYPEKISIDKRYAGKACSSSFLRKVNIFLRRIFSKKNLL